MREFNFLQQEPEYTKSYPSKVTKNRRRFISLGIVSAVLAVGCGGYYLWQNPDYIKSKLSKKEVTTDNKNLTSEISEFAVLPKDETPTVATVTDLNELKGLPFFSKAKVGYKVLIYSKAKKAMLYDPVAQKIIEVAPINISDVTPTPQAPTKTQKQ